MLKGIVHALALLLLAAPVAAEGLSGDYNVSGTGLEGSPYKGTATIRQTDRSCAITWRTPEVSEGFCFEYAGAFMAAYVSKSQRGMVFYKVNDDGSLAGVWNVDGSKGTGTEILTPKQVKSRGTTGVGAQKG